MFAATLPRSAALLLALACSVSAQKLTFGVVAGTSITDDFKGGTYYFPGGTIDDGQTTWSQWTVKSGSRGLIIGPKLELKLTGNFSVEAEALHRTLHSTSSSIEFFSGGSQRLFQFGTTTHASWEFPILARYRFGGRALRPFVEAGPSLRPAGSGTNVSHVGVSAGGGVEWRVRGFDIAPQVRYTHWKYAGGLAESIQDQVEFLVGFDRAPESGWASAFGRKFSLGVLAGVGLGDDLKLSRTPTELFGGLRSESNSPIAGALIEVALYRGLSLEANGIYRPLHGWETGGPNGDLRFAVLTWEFPVLAKYRFRAGRAWRPFVEAGPAFRLDGNFNGPMPSHYGVAAGAGVERRLWKFRISPTVRYTHWGAPRAPQGGGTFRNEVELLAGFAF